MTFDKLEEERYRLWKSLLKYCHQGQDCPSELECPRVHKECAKYLDLDTGIAWVAAGTLPVICEDYCEGCINVLNRSRSRLASLIQAVSYHEDKYSELFNLLCTAGELLGKLLNYQYSKEVIENDKGGKV